MRVHLYGLGRMGRHHERHLRDLGMDLIAIDPALSLPAPDEHPHAAVLAVPTSLHRAVAEPLLAAGIPCLLEKPLASTLEDSRFLSTFPHLSIGHIERYNPAISLLSGSLSFVQAERLAPYTGRSSDVDVILDLMIHDIDLFLASAPDDPVVEVRANGLCVRTGQVDIAQARLETRDGRVATLSASRVSRNAARHFRALVSGEYWSLDLVKHRAHRVRWGESLQEEAVPVPPKDALRSELEAFLDAVRSHSPMPIPAVQAHQAMEVAFQIKDAIAR